MFLTALVIGFLGSLHCAGMCSPLAMAVTNLSKPAFVNRFIYNGGRIVSYGLQGIAAASVGTLFEFTGLQQSFSITLGVLLIIAGFAGITRFNIPFLTKGIQTLTTFLKINLSAFIQKKTKVTLIITGILNGLLPCGLTYMALTYCLTITHPFHGFIFMLVFGIGTLPVMLGFTSIMQFLITRFNINFRSVTTVTMIALGVLLISRNLSHYHNLNSTGTDTITVCGGLHAQSRATVP